MFRPSHGNIIGQWAMNIITKEAAEGGESGAEGGESGALLEGSGSSEGLGNQIVENEGMDLPALR